MGTSEVVELTSALVAIDSVNPSLERGAAGEGTAAAFVAEWGRGAGLEVDVLEGTPGRPSVLVRAPGRGGGRSLLLCGHLDTVGPGAMEDPFEPRIEGDRLHGRGSYDMKAGVAAAFVACREAAAADLAGDVVVAAVADEEHASIGVREALRDLRADAAIVTEPTEMEVVIAHKGFVWFEVEVSGRAAHGSAPHLGIDAIVKSGSVLTALGELDGRLGERHHPLLGRGSVHASLIAGGRDLATYPDRCTISIERRSLPGESRPELVRELEELLAGCRAADPVLDVSASTLLVREPLETSESEPIVSLLRDAAQDLRGSRPPVSGASFWADSAFISAAGIPTVLFGPSGAGAHAEEEWVSVRDTEACAAVLTRVASELCA
jgi:acetylornithine deacetylase